MELTEDILTNLALIKQSFHKPDVNPGYFFDKKSQLPASADDYFKNYHDRAMGMFYVGYNELEKALIELRLAYIAYPERRARIVAISGVVKSGLAKKEQKKTAEEANSDTIS